MILRVEKSETWNKGITAQYSNLGTKNKETIKEEYSHSKWKPIYELQACDIDLITS